MTYRNAATLWAAFCLVPTLTLAQAPAAAPLFAAIGDKPAILYDGLSTKANKTFILSRFHPVEILVKLDKWTKVRDGALGIVLLLRLIKRFEILVKLDKWTKVRDADNTVGWMENAFIGEKKFVQVVSGTAEIRAAPNGNATIAFEAQRAVLLEATGAPSADGWLPVRHRDGQSGFVRVSQVWGA